jgi:hypothetical protein
VHVRVCVDCGEEFRPEIAVCSDCGGRLEDRYQDETGAWTSAAARRRATGAREAPPEDRDPGYPTLYWTAALGDLIPLAERLDGADIPHHVRQSPPAPGQKSRGFDLTVPVEHREAALRELAPLIGTETESGELHAVETAFDAQAGYRRCPACSRELQPGARECPECGLAVAGGPEEDDPGAEKEPSS